MEESVNYEALAAGLTALTKGVPHTISNLCNISALLWQTLPDINWAGFYALEGETLVLYPFQGKPACIEIPMGRGVCGTAAQLDEIQLVEDVHHFPGHIACDLSSNSEIVLPLHHQGKLWGVLDIDSPIVGRFTEADKEGLTLVASAIEGIL